jgi:hypothetical protein
MRLKRSKFFDACSGILALAIGGCVTEQDAVSEKQLTPEVAAEIEGMCGLPAGALLKGTVTADAWPKMACAIREAHMRGITVGFISNPVDPGS